MLHEPFYTLAIFASTMNDMKRWLESSWKESRNNFWLPLMKTLDFLSCIPFKPE